MALFRYFSWVSKLPSTKDTNIGLEGKKSVNAEVQHIMEGTENKTAQQGCKCKFYTAFTCTPEQRVSIGTAIVKYQHM